MFRFFIFKIMDIYTFTSLWLFFHDFQSKYIPTENINAKFSFYFISHSSIFRELNWIPSSLSSGVFTFVVVWFSILFTFHRSFSKVNGSIYHVHWLAICISFMTVALTIRALIFTIFLNQSTKRKFYFKKRKKEEDRKSNLVSILSSVFMFILK